MKNKFLVVQITGAVLVPLDARERCAERSDESKLNYETFVKEEAESSILHAINTATSVMRGTFHGEIEVTAQIIPSLTIGSINTGGGTKKKLHWKTQAKLDREMQIK
jgi:hypothetical protein